ncbi:MAG: hypothetical protein K9L64_05805 [Candidatus Izimaplasma sp.]|nr:hypothetical protein [Candidatus Izimaplasma bacterium]
MIFEKRDQFPNEFMFHEGVCVSLYQKTHRHSPENKKDSLMFKNLVKEIKKGLDKHYPEANAEEMFAKFKEIEEDNLFWKDTKDGLAILATSERMELFILEEEVETITHVSNRFYVLPLIEYFQSAREYFLLALNSKDFTLYRCNKEEIAEIKLPENDPKTLEEVLGEEHTENYLTHGTYAGGEKTVFHGHGGEKDDSDVDLKRYFTFVSKYVEDNYINPTNLPVVLVALKEHQGMFMKVTEQPYWLNTIDISFSAKKKHDIHHQANEIIKQTQKRYLQEQLEKFGNAEAKNMATEFLSEIAKAAYESRIDTLFVEKGKKKPGVFDYKTGEMIYGEEKAYTNDIIDDIAKYVIDKKGSVYVVERDMMPVESGICAIYRY